MIAVTHVLFCVESLFTFFPLAFHVSLGHFVCPFMLLHKIMLIYRLLLITGNYLICKNNSIKMSRVFYWVVMMWDK